MRLLDSISHTHLAVEYPGCLAGKESTCSRRHRFNSWIRKVPRRRKWLLTSVFLPGEFHGQRSLAGYCPWGSKELDITERLNWTDTKVVRDKVHKYRSTVFIYTNNEQGEFEFDNKIPLTLLLIPNEIRRYKQGFPGSSTGKESACYARDLSLIPGSVRSPEEGNGNSLQCSCLGRPRDRADWWATVHGVTKNLDTT